jgi:hypothetical protein
MQSETCIKVGVKMYQLFCKKCDELFFVDGTFEDVEGDVTLPGKSREYGISLSSDEDLPTNTSSPNFSPSHLTLIGSVVNTGFVEPYNVVCWDISICCLPSRTEEFILFNGSW